MSIPKVRMYTTPSCPHCLRAKKLLGDIYNVIPEEIDVSVDENRHEMAQKTGGARTVPQIFIGERHIGGADDLARLHAGKELSDMLQ